jgi:hypothetical protein
VEVASNGAVMSDVGSPVVAQAAEGEEDEEPRPEENGEDETVRYINPDTGETREYPARYAPRKPAGWVDTRDLPDPAKPMFFEPTEGHEPAGTVADAVAPGGVLPGEADNVGDVRTMPASADPDLTARAYVLRAYNGQSPVSTRPVGEDGSFVVKLPDGATITYRPAGQASWRTLSTTASVDVNDAVVNALNGGKRLKLTFPKL